MNVLISYASRNRHAGKIAKGLWEEASSKNKKKNNLAHKECFDDREALIESLYGAVKKTLNLSGEEWEDMVELMSRNPMIRQMTRCTNEEDAAKSKAFARKILV